MIRSIALASVVLSVSLAQPVIADAAGTIPRPPSVISPDLQMAPRGREAAPHGRAATAMRGHGLFRKQMQGQRTRGVAAHFLPQIVRHAGPEQPGTIIVDTKARLLYLVLDRGRAQRYGVGVGQPGFSWAGTHTVTRKAEWPDWTPPPEMIAREANKGRILPAMMKGGPANPLGARALYLGETLYRIHGTNEPWTIGHAVSSGCIRMRNEDVIDLYDRVPVGARVIVR